MTNRQIKLLQTFAVSSVSMFMMSHAAAEEKIIQQAEISFEKCLKVINTSANKLSIAPEIEDISNLERMALFKLPDGTLTITCNGVEGNITVSTNTN